MILEANTYPSIKRSLPPRCRNFVHTQLRWETTKRRSWALWRRRCWRTRSSSTRWRIMWARTSPWLSTSLLGSRLLLRWRQFEIHQPQWWIHELLTNVLLEFSAASQKNENVKKYIVTCSHFLWTSERHVAKTARKFWSLEMFVSISRKMLF